MRLKHDSRGLRRVSAAVDFGRVAVLHGGSSAEREISLLTGAAAVASEPLQVFSSAVSSSTSSPGNGSSS